MNENEKITCACCGEEFDRDDMTMVSNGDYVCESCRDEEYFLCECCDEWYPNDWATEVNVVVGWRTHTEYWCSDCAEEGAEECDDCGQLYRSDDMRHDDFSHAVCENCYSNHDWTTCAHCGGLLSEGDGCFDDEDDVWYCDECYREHASRSIHSYGHKPEPIFAKRQREHDLALLRYFGIELEVDNGENAQATAKAVTGASDGRIYCKRDGSLDCGFEIVTHPATLAYHLYDFRWANIMRICKKAGFKSHDTETCGLHVHVNRESLGSNGDERHDTALKLVLLSSALRDDLTKFSRRKAAHLDHWAALPNFNVSGLSNESLLALAKDFARYSRYQAVNLQNLHTVEFRIFRGTLKRDTLAASLQLVDNLCQFALTHTATECANASFVDVVNVNPTSVLLDYCQSRRIVTRTAS